MVFRRDQKTFVLKPFHWGSDVCMPRKSLFWGFSVSMPPPQLLHWLPGSLLPSMFIPLPTHTHSSQLAACLHNVLFSSLLGTGGGSKRGRPPGRAEECWCIPLHKPLALSHPGLAQSTDAFPATSSVPSAPPCPVMPSTKVLSLGTPCFI